MPGVPVEKGEWRWGGQAGCLSGGAMGLSVRLKVGRKMGFGEYSVQPILWAEAMNDEKGGLIEY